MLVIDCDEICKAGKSDDKLVSELASQTGYFPQFAFFSSFSE